jgi:hypothetical protein
MSRLLHYARRFNLVGMFFNQLLALRGQSHHDASFQAGEQTFQNFPEMWGKFKAHRFDATFKLFGPNVQFFDGGNRQIVTEFDRCSVHGSVYSAETAA